MFTGLGIDFDPPPSPPSVAHIAPNPAIARLQGQAALGRMPPARSFSANNVSLVQLGSQDAAQGDTDGVQDGHAVERKVRIVSAANIYHEDLSSPRTAHSESEEEEAEEQYEEQDEQEHYDDGEDDILDNYSEHIGDYGVLSAEEDLSPIPINHTAMSIRSMSAVSSGSSTRARDAASMDHSRHLTSVKAEQFEADLRGRRIPSGQAAHLARNLSQDLSETPFDDAASELSYIAPTQHAIPLPPKSSLRRTQAMSRPKSMMELSQLYAYQSIEEKSSVPAMVHSHYYDMVGIPMEPSYSRTSTTTSGTSPLSASTEEAYAASLTSGHSTAPSSISGSAEAKQQPVFHNVTAAGPQSHRLTKARSAISMRSAASMRGLENAEIGGSAVVLDKLGRGFTEGLAFHPSHAEELKSPPVIAEVQRQARQRAISVATATSRQSIALTTALTAADQPLQRQSTLLSANANPTKRAKELDRLLAPKAEQVRGQYSPTAQPFNSAEVPCQPVFSPGGTTFKPVGAGGYQPGLRRKASVVVLEQASKGKARVELDLVLASTLVVEGGNLKGRMEVRVRKEKDGEGEVWLGAVKARIVGFEELSGSEDARHVFYHHSAQIDNIALANGRSESLPCYGSQPDEEGFCRGKVGNHTFPFNMPLPVGKGAKGSLKSSKGVVKYIVIGSVKLKSHVGLDRSIAHFYRHVDVYPYLEPSIVLAPLPQPLRAEASKALFMAGSGKVKLSASLHRSIWVAGQSCYVDIKVANEGSKKVKSLTLSLTRTTTAFRPRPYLTAGTGRDGEDPVQADVDADACQTQTIRKKVAEETLEMGKKSTKGSVTAKGMWMGVDKGEDVDFCHFLALPSDALSIERGRHLEVTYSLKVSVSGSLSSDVSVELPIRIINFVSIDPPPGHTGRSAPATTADAPASMAAQNARNYQTPAVARMTSMDSLNITDLNRMYGLPSMSRGSSYDSSATSATMSATGTSSSGMSRAQTLPVSLMSVIDEQAEPELDKDSPPLPAMAQMVVQKAKERQMRHQISLDCISTAIASATARRQGSHSRTNSSMATLQTGPIVEESSNDSSLPYSGYPTPLPEPENIVQLDDLDDIPDDVDDLPYQQVQRFAQDLRSEKSQDNWLEYENESEDEVDLVLQTKHFESDDDEENRPASNFRYTRPVPSAPASRSTTPVAPLSPAKPTQQRRVVAPSSPALTRPSSALSQNKRNSTSSAGLAKATLDNDGDMSASLQFGLATPASPVKKGQAAIVAPPVQPRSRSGTSSSLKPSQNGSSGRRSPASSSMTSPRPSPAFVSPATTPRRPKGPTAQAPAISTVASRAASPDVRSRVAALEAGSPRKTASVAPAMRKMHSMSSLSGGGLHQNRRVSPSAVSAVSSVSPISRDWRLAGGHE